MCIDTSKNYWTVYIKEPEETIFDGYEIEIDAYTCEISSFKTPMVKQIGRAHV